MPDSETRHFAEVVREAAAWLHRHSHSTFVVSLLADGMSDEQLATVCDDIAMVSRLGARILLVYSTSAQRPDVDSPQQFEEYTSTLRDLENRILRNLERLPRGGWRNDALVRTTVLQAVRAKGTGVVSGTESRFHGSLRSLDTGVVEAVLEVGGIAVLPVVANSLVGESLVLDPYEMASDIAVLLRADKWIVVCRSDVQPRWESLAKRAVAVGVDRAHHVDIADPSHLVTELFSNRGVSTMMVSSVVRDISRASLGDLGKVAAVLEEAEEEGSILKRSRSELERDIDSFITVSVDDVVVGCAALLPHGQQTGEIAALTVASSHRRRGLAGRLISELESRAKNQGLTRLIVLTTRAPEWFEIRGYQRTTLDALPDTKRDFYNFSRNSIVLQKHVQ